MDYYGLNYYEKDLEIAYIMEQEGLETEEDYYNWVEQQKENAQLRYFEDN